MRRARRLFSSIGGRKLAGSGLRKLIGFGASVLLLAAAALVLIPAMIAASGAAAWGSIALGQAVGAISAVAVLYGWGWYGPARIARAPAGVRRAEYLESVYTRLLLALPASATAAVVAYLLAPGTPHFAAVGAVSMTSVGLTAQWYFVGLARPLPFLVLETIPRVTGILLGVALMQIGHSAVVGPMSMAAGMFAGFTCSSVWIVLETTRNGAEVIRLRRPTEILVLNRHGMISALGGAAYNAAPLAIVSLIAPGIQPVFALADKVIRQIHAVAIPAVVVLQGWVPRGSDSTRVRRANIALAGAGSFALLLFAMTLIVAPHLIDWLGKEHVSVSWPGILLISLCVSVGFFEATLARAALATFGRLQVVAKAVIIGSAVGLPLVSLGAASASVPMALGGVLTGLGGCVVIELVDYVRVVARATSPSE